MICATASSKLVVAVSTRSSGDSGGSYGASTPVKSLISPARARAVGRDRRDQRYERDRSGVRHQPRHLPDATDVLGAVTARETQII